MSRGMGNSWVFRALSGAWNKVFGRCDDKSAEEYSDYPRKKRTRRGRRGGRRHRKPALTVTPTMSQPVAFQAQAECGTVAGKKGWSFQPMPERCESSSFELCADDCFECFQDRHEKQMLDAYKEQVSMGFEYRFRRGFSHGMRGRQQYKDRRMRYAPCAKLIAPVIAKQMDREAEQAEVDLRPFWPENRHPGIDFGWDTTDIGLQPPEL